MIEIREIDPSASFMTQLQEVDSGPVTVINTFIFPEGEYEAFLDVWQKDSFVMMASPGFISAQLHRGLGDSRTVTNVATWESAAQLGAALASDEFQELLALYPEGTVVYPALERKVAIPGVCEA